MEVDIAHLAWLARLALSEEEEEELRKRLRKARRLVDRILEARVEGVEPLYHPHDMEGRLREDEPLPGLDRESVLANAAQTEDGYIVGPRTIEE